MGKVFEDHNEPPIDRIVVQISKRKYIPLWIRRAIKRIDKAIKDQWKLGVYNGTTRTGLVTAKQIIREEMKK